MLKYFDQYSTQIIILLVVLLILLIINHFFSMIFDYRIIIIVVLLYIFINRNEDTKGKIMELTTQAINNIQK
jgi:MFS superfamily sulfate permease-like transporter